MFSLFRKRSEEDSEIRHQGGRGVETLSHRSSESKLAASKDPQYGYLSSGQAREDMRKFLAEIAEELRATLKHQVLAELRRDLEDEVRADLRSELEAEMELHLIEIENARKRGILLDFYLTTEAAQIRASAVVELKRSLQSEVAADLRRELLPNVRAELTEELRPIVSNSQELANQVKDEMRASLRDEVKRVLFREMRPEVTETLRQILRPEIEGALRGELTLPMVESIASNDGGSVASVLQQARFHMEMSIREQLREEARRAVMDEFAEWLWARGELSEPVTQSLLHQARKEILGDENAPENHVGVSFTKALEIQRCSRTGAEIVPEELFIRIGEAAHKLPSSYSEAVQIAKLALQSTAVNDKVDCADENLQI